MKPSWIAWSVGLWVLGYALPVQAWQACDWSRELSESAPSPREGHAMAYDEARGEVVLFGGNDGSPRGDTWTWNADTRSWTFKSEAGPSPRWLHNMVYDSNQRVVVLHGGWTEDGDFSHETWKWNGVSWSLECEDGPSRVNFSMAYDPDRDEVVLFGGWDDRPKGDTWVYDGSCWTKVKEEGEGPPARTTAAMSFDYRRRAVILFGGAYYDSEPFKDTWEWNGENWLLLCNDGPPPRYYSTMIADPDNKELILFGGFADHENGRNDTWTWNGLSDCAWMDCISEINRPAARLDHKMAFDVDHHEVVLFGGVGHRTGEDYLGDTWVLPRPYPPLCEMITGLKAKCKYGHGRFKVCAKVVTALPEGTVVALCLDLNECDLNGDEDCQDVTINSRGKAKGCWTTPDKGDHCVIVRECPDIHRSVSCLP